MEMVVPFRFSPEGGVAQTNDVNELAAQHIITAVLTRKKERVYRPDFGTRVSDLVFEALRLSDLAAVKEEIRTSVTREVPDVRLVSVDVTQAGDDRAEVRCQIDYVIPPQGTVYQVLFPLTPLELS